MVGFYFQRCSFSGAYFTFGKLSAVLFLMWNQTEGCVLQPILAWDRRYALEMQIILQSWVTELLFWLVERWDLQPEMVVGEIHTFPFFLGSVLVALSPGTGKWGPWWVWQGKLGTGVLCCVTQLGMSTPSTRGCCFPILGNFVFLFFGFFFPSSLSNHQRSLLPAICLGSSPSHSEHVRHSLNLALSKSLLGFLISTKPLFSCISSKECQATAQSIIWKPGCLQHTHRVLTYL